MTAAASAGDVFNLAVLVSLADHFRTGVGVADEPRLRRARLAADVSPADARRIRAS